MRNGKREGEIVEYPVYSCTNNNCDNETMWYHNCCPQCGSAMTFERITASAKEAEEARKMAQQ